MTGETTTSTTTTPEGTRLPIESENYIEFQTYTRGINIKALRGERLRMYNNRMQVIGSSGSMFPLVKSITLEISVRNRETGRLENVRSEFFELRNADNKLMFITDQEGIDSIFGLGDREIPK